MKNEFQSGTSYVPSFRTGSTDVNTIQHRYFQEPKLNVLFVQLLGLITYLLSLVSVLLLSIHRLSLVQLYVCVVPRKRGKEAENDILFYRA